MYHETTGPAVRQRWADYDAEAALAGLRMAAPAAGLVVGQLGQSLDGRIATPSGASKYINGSAALCHLHALRAAVDAVIVGVGTAIADDPQLTTRLVDGPNPVRVVIDPNGRLPASATMLSDGAAPVLVVTCRGSRSAPGAERLELPCRRGGMRPADIVAALAARGLARLLVEGGADTLGRFINAGAIDELHLLVAPIVIGSGKTGINLAPIERLDQALRPEVRTMRFADGDMLALCTLTPAARENENAA